MAVMDEFTAQERRWGCFLYGIWREKEGGPSWSRLYVLERANWCRTAGAFHLYVTRTDSLQEGA